jgi:hypothetical protein
MIARLTVSITLLLYNSINNPAEVLAPPKIWCRLCKDPIVEGLFQRWELLRSCSSARNTKVQCWTAYLKKGESSSEAAALPETQYGPLLETQYGRLVYI